MTGAAPKALWLLFIAAFVVRAAYVLGLYLGIGPEGLMVEDSALYLELARNVVVYGDFVREAAGGGVVPETERVPLYVIYLAAHQAVAGGTDPLFPALTQAALGALAVTFIARLAHAIDPRLLLPAGIFAAVNPTQIVVGASLLTESLFFLWIALALYATGRWLGAANWRWALLLGLALGLGIATRAMLVPWAAATVVLLPLLAVWLGRFRPSAIAQMAVVLAICFAVQAPILARNLSRYDSIHLTSQAGAYTMLWIAPLVREAVDGTPHEVGAAALWERYMASVGGVESANPFENSSRMTAVANAALRELGLGAAAKAWLLGAALNLFSPSLIMSPPVSALPRTGFYDTPGANKLEKIGNFLFRNDNPTYAWILLLSILALLAVRAAQLWGLGAGLLGQASREARLILVLLLLWALYILLVNGPIASPKYRLPIEPLSAISAAFAFLTARDWLHRRAARRQAQKRSGPERRPAGPQPKPKGRTRP